MEPPYCGIRFDPRKLFIGNLRLGFVSTHVTAYLGRELGVVARQVYPERTQGVRTFVGSCHVEFHNHTEAVQARCLLLEHQWNNPLAADGHRLTAHRGPRLFTDYRIMVKFLSLEGLGSNILDLYFRKKVLCRSFKSLSGIL